MRRLRPLAFALTASTALLLARPAAADAIDGHWCTDGGIRLSISGPSIVTPGGVRMQGEYGRHDFAYDAPASEPGGGGRVVMRLCGEDLMQVQAAGLDPLWRRCGPATS
jgi:hypothetical protein